MKNVAREDFQVAVNFLNKYKKIIIGSVGSIVLVGGGYLFYNWQIQAREEKAQLALVEGLNYFEAKVKTPDLKVDQLSIDDVDVYSTEEEKWIGVVDVFDKAYTENKSSSLASIFVALKSDALVKLGKLDEAISSLESVVAKIKNIDIQDLYQVKLGLMQLDSSSEELNSKGLERIKNISDKSDSAINDLALYRLGEYYWIKKDFDQAKSYWNRLMVKFGPKTSQPSHWAALAIDKLQLIDATV